MRRRHPFFNLLVLAIITLVIMAGCGTAAPAPSARPSTSASTVPSTAPQSASPSSAPAKPKEALKLKVATPHPGTPETDLAVIGEAKGYFKAEGLEVEFVFTKGGGDTVQAVVSGGADIGLNCGPMSILGAIEKGADVKIVSAAITPPEQWWMAAKDSPYKAVKDVAGQKLGYTSQGSSSNLMLLAILEKAGVQAEPVAAGGFSEQWTQVKTGQLAAGMIGPPEAWKIIDQDGGRRIFASTDYPEFAEYTYVVNFARSDSIKSKSDALKAFFRGWKKAADFVRTDPEGTTKIYMPNTEIPEPLVLRYFKEIPPTKFRLSPIGGMDISVKYAKTFKFITKDPDLKTVVDLSMLPQ